MSTSVQQTELDKTMTTLVDNVECAPGLVDYMEVDCTPTPVAFNAPHSSCVNCRERFVFKSEKYRLERRVTRQWRKIKQLSGQIKQLMTENRMMKKKLATYDNLPPKAKLIVEQTLLLHHGYTEWLYGVQPTCKATFRG